MYIYIYVYTRELCWQVVSVQHVPGSETSENLLEVVAKVSDMNIPKHGGVLLLKVIYQYLLLSQISRVYEAIPHKQGFVLDLFILGAQMGV